MTLYISSDLHVNHEKILKFEPRRVQVLGSTIQEHDASLLKRFNAILRPEDRLILAGDIGFSSSTYLQEFLSKLNTKHIMLVRGNHDKHSDMHYLKIGYEFVCYEMKLKIASEFVRVSHYPYQKPWYEVSFPWQFKPKDYHKRPKNTGHILLHGHIHSGGSLEAVSNVYKRQIHIGVDANDYKPVSLKTLEKIISRIVSH